MEEKDRGIKQMLKKAYAYAVFNVVNGVLLRPLPYPTADRITMVWMDNRRQGIKYAAAEAPIRQVRQDDEREASRERVRFVDSETGEVIS